MGSVHNAKGSGFFIFTCPYLLIYHIGKPPVSLDHGTQKTGGLWKKEIMTVFPSKKSVIFSVRKEVTGVMTHSTSVTFISRKHESFFYRNHIITG